VPRCARSGRCRNVPWYGEGLRFDSVRSSRLWRFFEPRTEYLTCREWHSEWHAARMRKPLTRYFLDVKRLSLREQVQGPCDFAGTGGRRVAGYCGGLGRAEEDGRSAVLGSPATAPPLI
jgi:hypothetical protein